MREIKFRGKRVDNGEWVYGDLTGGDTIHIQPPIIDDNGGCEWWGYKVIPETVGQYTGLKDKNGKEIWEGDIVECIDHPTELENRTGAIVYSCGRYWPELGSLLSIDEYGSSWTKVIGNIHDNPELLKDGTT